ncbi:MAG: class I SAM-dependent methyltransferase [Myxococcales bacterium]|jgi:putative AdoMet-dependent methyltransferase|nr:class I SAM-dependent methyltransferase [Myxococcales bacterium]
MGREFLEVFTDWADSYDGFIEGAAEEYSRVFQRYDEILDEVVNRSGQTIIEFGVGTGNLTKKFLDKGKKVFPIEPSVEMRSIASTKLGELVTIHDGDLLDFPKPEISIDTIAHSFVFHHLTDPEKREALRLYHALLAPGGKMVYADTMFLTQEAFDEEIRKAEAANYLNLSADLKREYYPLIPNIQPFFVEQGFDVSFKQYNDFVWLVEAIKK